MATQPPSFQKLILTLHDYWSERGCLILQPYDMEMGAGVVGAEAAAGIESEIVPIAPRNAPILRLENIGLSAPKPLS